MFGDRLSARLSYDSRLIATVWLFVPAIALPDFSKVIAADAAEGSAQDKAAIAKNAEAFVAAFHKADAKALAAFWTPDGDYTTVTGRRLKGREEIEKAYRQFFADHKNLKVRIDSESLRFIAPDVAIEEGTSEVFSTDGGPPSRARFKNIHVKKQDQWFLSSVQDSGVHAADQRRTSARTSVGDRRLGQPIGPRDGRTNHLVVDGQSEFHCRVILNDLQVRVDAGR